MSVIEAPPTVPDPAPAPEPPSARTVRSNKMRRAALIGLGLFVILSFVRLVTDSSQLTASITVGAALRATIPILLAGLAALWADRVGIVNIGIEGMMILGTWFGGYAAWQWGAYVGVVFAVVGGVIGGLIHGIAVTRFNVDHIISGVAINILALGAMRYLSELIFVGEQGGGITQSPQQSSSIGKVSLPFLSGGWDTPDALGNLEERGWFLISDAAGIIRGLTVDVSYLSILAILLVPLSAWILWRTRFGLRIRSSGEQPYAAESLGVKVAPLRYWAMAISGGLAGLGGGFLAIVATSFYRQGQTQQRGFIGLATAIFGNWRPSGVLGGASLFGFGEALQLVGSAAVPKLFLVFAIIGAIAAVRAAVQRNHRVALVLAAIGGLSLIAFVTVDEVPEPLTKSVPFVLTIVVLATSAQRLRPPAHDGKPFRSGEEH
ncbi:MAG: ABC transporter permease [Actinomycetota bacterium]